jgi:multidrug efflux pump subunit AcrA (membrane-fusion protein)
MKLPNFKSILRLISAKKWWLVVVVVLIVGGIFYFRQQQAKKVVLKFSQPIRQDITQTLQASGVVDAKEKALLRFAAGGKLVYLGAKEGDVVKKWQTIATIDARDLKKRLEKSLNTYSQQRNSWDQTLDDTKDRAIATRENRTVNTSQLTLDNIVVDVELASIGISNTGHDYPNCRAF